MPCFRKLSFPSAKIADQVLAKLDPMDSVVILGHLCETTDEEGKCIKVRKEFSVDVLFHADEPSKLAAPYVIWPKPCGVHAFAGWEQQYEADYNKHNADIKQV
jgi:hypothetical protein